MSKAASSPIVTPDPEIIELGTLGKEAIGSIEPKTPEQYQLINAIKENINGLFVPSTQNIVGTCIDGRLPHPSNLKNPQQPAESLKPNSAGGSLSLWIAAVLGGAQVSLNSFLVQLKAGGISIGSHSDSHAHGGATGCGANDKLPQILGALSKKNTLASILAFMAKLGVELDVKATDQFRERVNILNNSGVFGTASMRLEELSSKGSCDVLAGDHNELLIIINMVSGTTLNRAALVQQFGLEAAAFNVDAWAFDQSASQIQAICDFDGVPQNRSDLIHQSLVQALVAYNLATGFVLCGPAMPIVVRAVG